MTMDEFLIKVVDENHKPSTGKAVAKTLAFTALATLLTLPFGFTAFSVSRNKSKAEVKASLDEKLYLPFKTYIFDEKELKNTRKRDRADYRLFLDSLSIESKMKVLNSVLTNPNEYLEFVNSNAWRKQMTG